MESAVNVHDVHDAGTNVGLANGRSAQGSQPSAIVSALNGFDTTPSIISFR